MLGNIGPDRLWKLIKAGELDSYLVGRSRFITVESIERYVARHLAEARDENGRVKLYDHNPAPAPRPAADAGSAKVPRKRRRNTDQTLRRPVAASPTQQRGQQTPASAP
jgi:hypothetical protein